MQKLWKENIKAHKIQTYKIKTNSYFYPKVQEIQQIRNISR